MSLGGVDAIVFTAGVGEHAAGIRAAACEGMAFLGVELDLAENESGPVDKDIATGKPTLRLRPRGALKDISFRHVSDSQILDRPKG